MRRQPVNGLQLGLPRTRINAGSKATSKNLLKLIKHTDGGMKLPVRAARSVGSVAVARGVIDNARVVQTCARPVSVPGLVAARSLFDRAHQQRDIEGKLVPAARKVGRTVKCTVQHSSPRLYPQYYCTLGGATFEETSDWLYEASKRLDGVAGIGLREAPTAAEQATRYLNRLKGDVGYDGARNMTRRRS